MGLAITADSLVWGYGIFSVEISKRLLRVVDRISGSEEGLDQWIKELERTWLDACAQHPSKPQRVEFLAQYFNIEPSKALENYRSLREQYIITETLKRE